MRTGKFIATIMAFAVIALIGGCSSSSNDNDGASSEFTYKDAFAKNSGILSDSNFRYGLRNSPDGYCESGYCFFEGENQAASSSASSEDVIDLLLHKGSFTGMLKAEDDDDDSGGVSDFLQDSLMDVMKDYTKGVIKSGMKWFLNATGIAKPKQNPLLNDMSQALTYLQDIESQINVINGEVVSISDQITELTNDFTSYTLQNTSLTISNIWNTNIIDSNMGQFLKDYEAFYTQYSLINDTQTDQDTYYDYVNSVQKQTSLQNFILYGNANSSSGTSLLIEADQALMNMINDDNDWSNLGTAASNYITDTQTLTGKNQIWEYYGYNSSIASMGFQASNYFQKAFNIYAFALMMNAFNKDQYPLYDTESKNINVPIGPFGYSDEYLGLQQISLPVYQYDMFNDAGTFNENDAIQAFQTAVAQLVNNFNIVYLQPQSVTNTVGYSNTGNPIVDDKINAKLPIRLGDRFKNVQDFNKNGNAFSLILEPAGLTFGPSFTGANPTCIPLVFVKEFGGYANMDYFAADCQCSDGTSSNVYQLFINTDDSGTPVFDEIDFQEGFGLTAQLTSLINNMLQLQGSGVLKNISKDEYYPSYGQLILSGLWGFSYYYKPQNDPDGFTSFNQQPQDALNETYSLALGICNLNTNQSNSDSNDLYALTSSGHLIFMQAYANGKGLGHGDEMKYNGAFQISFGISPAPITGNTVNTSQSGGNIQWDDGTEVTIGNEYDTHDPYGEIYWNWNITETATAQIQPNNLPLNLTSQDPWEYVQQWGGQECSDGTTCTPGASSPSSYFTFIIEEAIAPNTDYPNITQFVCAGYDYNTATKETIYFDSVVVAFDSNDNSVSIVCNSGYNAGSSSVEEGDRTYTGTGTLPSTSSASSTTASPPPSSMSGTYQITGDATIYTWSATLSSALTSLF